MDPTNHVEIVADVGERLRSIDIVAVSLCGPLLSFVLLSEKTGSCLDNVVATDFQWGLSKNEE